MPGVSAKNFQTVDLRCENYQNPVGIDNPIPSFSWKIVSSEKSKFQKAYRIIVSSSKELSKSCIGDMWDSNKIYSDQQFGIKYEGKGLKTTEKYWWRVMVWDDKDNSSQWSDIVFFVTGFFSPYDWQAKWFDAENDAVFARRDFIVNPSKTVKNAFLYGAALGNLCNSFQLRLNGEIVGSSVLFPGPTEYIRALY